MRFWGPRRDSFMSIRSKRDISAARRHFMNSGTSLTATPRQSVWVRPQPRCMPSGGSARTRRCRFEGRHNAAEASQLPGLRLVCDQQFTDFLHTRKWKFSFRAQHRSVCCGHNHRPTIWKPSLGALRCLWPGLGCRIFTAHAQRSFLVGCLHGWCAWVFDQSLHCAPAMTVAVGSSVVGHFCLQVMVLHSERC